MTLRVVSLPACAVVVPAEGDALRLALMALLRSPADLLPEAADVRDVTTAADLPDGWDAECEVPGTGRSVGEWLAREDGA